MGVAYLAYLQYLPTFVNSLDLTSGSEENSILWASTNGNGEQAMGYLSRSFGRGDMNKFGSGDATKY
jgi:hypothetical protein